MTILSMLQKGAPDLTNFTLILIGILVGLLALNFLYEWLMSKPWKKSGTHTDATSDNTSPTSHTEPSDEKISRSKEHSNSMSQETIYATNH